MKIEGIYPMNTELFGKKETYGLWYELFKLALKGMNMDLEGDIYSSGELYVCELLKKLGMDGERVFFDVGANIGEYTKTLKEHFPKSTIHCFEPAKETFKVLEENVGANENVVLNNIAISDRAEERKLYYDDELSGLASLYKRKLDYYNIDFSKSEIVKVGTLDDYCERYHIDVIDFLKMDVEGNEFKALQGAGRLLQENRINIIQLEFGGTNIDARTYFRDFWNLLHENYYAYRILKNGLWEIKRYTERLECFCCTNYMFINKELVDDCEGKV